MISIAEKEEFIKMPKIDRLNCDTAEVIFDTMERVKKVLDKVNYFTILKYITARTMLDIEEILQESERRVLKKCGSYTDFCKVRREF